VEDEPAAAALAVDLCELNGTRADVYRDGQLFLDALRTQRPAVLVLDWRLERGLAAPLFMAARHREPGLPVVFWTGTAADALPQMIRQDPRARIVDKAEGAAAFERALRWAMESAGIGPSAAL
jgi:FixJ family two-component response regulator